MVNLTLCAGSKHYEYSIWKGDFKLFENPLGTTWKLKMFQVEKELQRIQKDIKSPGAKTEKPTGD